MEAFTVWFMLKAGTGLWPVTNGLRPVKLASGRSKLASGQSKIGYDQSKLGFTKINISKLKRIKIKITEMCSSD